VPFTRMRIVQITTETGATIGVEFTSASDCVAPVTVDPSANTGRCFPVKWTPPGRSNPVSDWFHKYAVNSVTEQENTVSRNAVYTSYAYRGAALHYDYNEVVVARNRTLGQLRGYS